MTQPPSASPLQTVTLGVQFAGMNFEGTLQDSFFPIEKAVNKVYVGFRKWSQFIKITNSKPSLPPRAFAFSLQILLAYV